MGVGTLQFRQLSFSSHHSVSGKEIIIAVILWGLAGGQDLRGVDFPSEQTNQAPAAPSSELKGLSLEQLMSLEVTSAARKPEPWFTSASAIQVVTHDDIERSGASSLPEALRLAPNLQVAQVDSRQWAITARGFNNGLANKLRSEEHTSELQSHSFIS